MSCYPPFPIPAVSISTATDWLHQLGFEPLPTHSKRGVYKDGHEREDVVDYRKDFVHVIRELEACHPPPPCPPGGFAVDTVLDAAREKARDGGQFVSKPPVIIAHDESTFHANDDQRFAWQEKGSNLLLPKTQGSGIMVSDFIDEHTGFLRLSTEEFTTAVAQGHEVGYQEARMTLEIGANHEGYWNGDKFLFQVEDAPAISRVKYPREQFDVLWVFDQSTGHAKMAEDALVASRMNVNPGGSQPCMHDTYFGPNKTPQTMCTVSESGEKVPKGLKNVLSERGHNITGLNKSQLVELMSKEPDFVHEPCQVVEMLVSAGDRAMLLPKFHCELNPIERVWGKAKRHTRAICDYTIGGLRTAIPAALSTVSVEDIRQYFRKSRDFLRAYAEGFAPGPEMTHAMTTYKSHRRVPEVTSSSLSNST